MIVFADERVINQDTERKRHKIFEDSMRNQRNESENIQQNKYATFTCNFRIIFQV